MAPARKKLGKHKVPTVVALAQPGETTPDAVARTKKLVSPGYARETLVIPKDPCYFDNKAPGIGLGLMELPSTNSMPSRLIVINTSSTGLAAQAGLEIRDQLISVAGHDVATELENSKARVNALLIALGGASDLEVIVERKAARNSAPSQHADARVDAPSGAALASPSELPLGEMKLSLTRAV